jgi:hypothetical protein
MKQIRLLGLTTLLLSFVICCQTAQKKTPSDIPKNWKTITDKSYTIQYPDSFELNKSGQMGTSFILFTKPSSSQDTFRENINLIIQDLGGQNIGLDEYVKISEGQIKTIITDANIIESKRVKPNGSQFQRVVYTGKQGLFNLKWLQYYWIEKGKAYALTLTCEENQFDKYLKLGEQIMSTFKIQ